MTSAAMASRRRWGRHAHTHTYLCLLKRYDKREEKSLKNTSPRRWGMWERRQHQHLGSWGNRWTGGNSSPGSNSKLAVESGIGGTRSFWTHVRILPIPISHPPTSAETRRLILGGSIWRVPGPAEHGRGRQKTGALSRQTSLPLTRLLEPGSHQASLFFLGSVDEFRRKDLKTLT